MFFNKYVSTPIKLVDSGMCGIKLKFFLREIREFDACIGAKVVQKWSVSGPLFSLRNFKGLIYLGILLDIGNLDIRGKLIGIL